MKPIEAGCRAIIIRTENSPNVIGKVVLVEKLEAAVSEVEGSNYWWVSGNFQATNALGGIIADRGITKESNLLRIDGDDFSQDEHIYTKEKDKVNED